MSTTQFKVGDRVRIVTCRSYPSYNGTIGIIYHVGEDCCYINERQQYNRELAFRWNDCLIEHDIYGFPPQSPQPQQTQQKEDNMYGVITFTHTNNGSTLVAKTTEAEAKAFAEQQVAAYRSNVQVKQYFSISIVDMRTGKFVGSVVDAPPAVDWS